MKSLLNSVSFSGWIAAGVGAAIVLPTYPASADLLQDVGVGAAANVVAGEVLDNGNVVNNAIGGAVTGAAVSVTHNDKGGVLGVVQDAAVGAAANVVTGIILNNGGVGDNAISGAATGAVVGVTTD
ncbi:MAG: hypothetical protein QNJ46_10270 [Leptolyngbyaceae cyanobacterium MO_188.B28]|nr:hypothetical protein [Leptolyngbyaceae cyanobacterium MO_188.B28]